MSQLILDNQLDLAEVLPHLTKWITAQRLQSLRPGEKILDDRVPEILCTLERPTFVTIDQGFWHSRWCHPGYCILYFALREDQQKQLPGLLRALFRRPEFQTRAARMGKVARISSAQIDYWEYSKPRPTRIPWTDPAFF